MEWTPRLRQRKGNQTLLDSDRIENGTIVYTAVRKEPNGNPEDWHKRVS
jgi:hypothetical protein